MSKPFNKLASSLEAMLSTTNILSFNTYNDEIDVIISIPDTDNTLSVKDLAINLNEEAYMSTDEFGNKQYFINGKPANVKKVEQSRLKQDRLIKRKFRAIKKVRQEHLRQLAKQNPFLSKNNSFKKALKKGNSSFVVKLKKNSVKSFIEKNSKHIAVADLPKEVQNSSLYTAMLATKIDPIALNNYYSRGRGIGIFVSEVGSSTSFTCPNIAVREFSTNYTNLEGGIGSSKDSHAMLVNAIVRNVAPDAHLYCNSFAPNNLDDYLNPFPNISQTIPIRIQNYSWNTYKDIESHGLTYNRNYTDVDRKFDNYVYTSGQNIFVSSGNRGSKGGNNFDYVLSPGKAMNVITVGNYIDTVHPYKINSNGEFTSSFRDPSTGAQKPEISAPGTNISTEIHTPGTPTDKTIPLRSNTTGSSFATPHAAAFAADAMSNESFLKNSASLLKAYMLASATDAVSGGHDRVGEGGIKFQPNIKNTFIGYSKSSRNELFRALDGCFVDWRVYLKASSSTKVALSWLNRGDYVIANNKTGIDLGLYMYGSLPVGNPNASFHYKRTQSNVDPYEVFTFSPPITGRYAVYVCMNRDDDRDSKINFGVAISQQ